MKFFNIIVYVPADNSDEYIKIIQDHIKPFGKQYDRVAWWSEPKVEFGVEQFRPLDGSLPALGEINETVQKASVRIEISFPHDRSAAQNFIKNILIAHHVWNDPIVQLFEGEIII